MSAEGDLQEFLQDYARCDGDEASAHAKHFLNAYAHELAEKVRKHADDPRVKPHLLEGEWTGLRMGANVIDRRR